MAKRKIFPAEQIIMKLRGAEVLPGQGKSVKEACRVLGISEQTYNRCRKENGGLNTTQAKKQNELEKENTRLKRLVADLSLDNAILKEVLSKKVVSRGRGIPANPRLGTRAGSSAFNKLENGEGQFHCRPSAHCVPEEMASHVHSTSPI